METSKLGHLNSEQLTSTFCFMLNFFAMDYTLNIVSAVFSLYLNIHGLQKGPGKTFHVGPGKSWIFFSQ